MSSDYDDRERFYRCRICSCYYRRRSDIENHVLNNHGMNMPNSIQEGVLYRDECNFCGTVLAQSSYNRHIQNSHMELYSSANRVVRQSAPTPRQQGSSYRGSMERYVEDRRVTSLNVSRYEESLSINQYGARTSRGASTSRGTIAFRGASTSRRASTSRGAGTIRGASNSLVANSRGTRPSRGRGRGRGRSKNIQKIRLEINNYYR